LRLAPSRNTPADALNERNSPSRVGPQFTLTSPKREAADLFKLVDGFTRTLEATVFEQRVARLERMAGIAATSGGQGAKGSQGAADPAQDSGAAP
jgi:hypothetical protein